MIQEGQNQMCSNSSGGDESGSIVTRSSSSRKLKQKKVPQRGLGVAQLEKIRMEEQQKKDGNNNDFSTLLSSSTNSSSQNATIPNKLTNFPHANNQKPSKPFLPYSPPSPPPMPMNLSPQNPIFRTHSLPNTENFHLNSIPPLNPINGDGFQVRWPSISVHGNVSFPKMWHPSPHHEFFPDHNKGENSVFLPNMSLPYDTSNVAPLPDVLPRSTTPQLQSPPSNSMVNVSSMNLSSSSVLSFPMEPPSNQSFYGSYSSLLWQDEEKMMGGVKRSCPFPLDNPPMPKFHSKYAPTVANNLLSRSEESTSGGNGGTSFNNLDTSIPIFRDMPSCPSALPEPANSRKMSRSENGNSHTQEFLTLMTPPTITSSSNNPNSRLKQLCKLDGLPYQVSIEDPLMDSTRKEGSSQKPSLLSFFPPTKLQSTATAANNHDSCNSEVGESIDLNLRL